MAKQTWVGSDRVKTVLLESIPSNTDEFYEHKVATTGEHGITGTITGTSDVQVLTNKTMSAPDNTFTGFRHGEEVDDLATGVHGITGQVVGTSDVQTLTNKTLADVDIQGVVGKAGSVVTTDAAQTLTNKTLVDVDIQGVVGKAGSVVTTDAAQTLTNKTVLLAEPVVPAEAATKNYVDQTAFNTALPDLTGHAGTMMVTDGVIAKWGYIPATNLFYFNNNFT